MILFFIAGIFIFGGLYLLYLGEASGCLLAGLGGIALIVMLILLPLQHATIKGQIQQFKATQATYEMARKMAARLDGPDLELAAIQLDVAAQNRWLADVQYWNGTLMDVWFPDEVMDLKPIVLRRQP